MKRLLYELSLLIGLLIAPIGVQADNTTTTDGEQQNIIRMYMNTGETIDFNAALIDSITATPTAQCIWMPDTCHEFAINTIDSVVYISPMLRLTTSSLDFGKVAVGNGKTTRVTITNTGDFTESYFVLADGVFSSALNGLDCLIEGGMSQSIDLTFKPTQENRYNGVLQIFSTSAAGGQLRMPLTGEGVAADSLEENIIPTPVERDFLVMLPEDMPISTLEGHKIVNCYGEFPLQVPTNAKHIRKVKREGNTFNAFYSPGQMSPNGMQTHSLFNGDNPMAFFFTLPGTTPEISIDEIAIDLLMSEPLMITSDETEYRNTVKLIKSLPSYSAFKAEVLNLYKYGEEHSMCMDYSRIDASNVIYELLNKVFDNRDLTLSGVSLIDKNITHESAKYRLHNDYKRLIHIYPGRGNMLDATVNDDDNYTLQELCEWLLDYANTYDVVADKEDRAFIADLKEWVGEIENAIVSFGFGDTDSHITLPIMLQSPCANYWKIVKGSLMGEKNSIYETSTEEIETKFNDYDKVLIDVYGLGPLNKPWNQYSGSEKFRIAFALLHSSYIDVIKPMIDVVAGWNAVKDATGSDNFKYDFRYGKRKYPELALVIRLCYDFIKDPDNRNFIYHWDEYDVWDKVKFFTTFAYNTILTCASETPEMGKRTYINLIYNIYKKYSKNTATSAAFRESFKRVANNLTFLKKMNFVGKVADLSAHGVDIGGIIYAYTHSSAQETFNLAKSTSPFITVLQPTQVFNTVNRTVHFEWEAYEAFTPGPYLYSMEMEIETPSGTFRTMVMNDNQTTSYDCNLADIPHATGAIRIKFRLTARRTISPQIVAATDFIPLVDLVASMPEFRDLGLPSGTLWAIKNLGAEQGVDIGNYYAWGETTGFNEGKTSFTWGNYKYAQGTHNSLTKYCTLGAYGNNGFTDGLTELQGSDDPVSSLYGYSFSIPTKEQWEELITLCTWKRLDYGVWVTGPNGEGIYLPCNGYRNGSTLYDNRVAGYYWSSTLDEHSPDDAWFLYFTFGKPSSFDYYRCYGRCVRPVMRKTNTTPPGAPSVNTQQAGQPTEQHGNGGLVVKTVSRSAVEPSIDN